MPPGGYKRSRALWDEARQKGAPITAWVNAILYELQPFRFASLTENRDGDAFRGKLERILVELQLLAHETIPSFFKSVVKFLKGLSRKHCMYAGLALVYVFGVKYIHQILDAGPLVLILSAFVAIYVYGLGDEGAGGGGVSAYSVFNRGFERMMGGVDAEALVNQHVGGAMGAMMAVAGAAEVEANEGERGRAQRVVEDRPRRGAHNPDPLARRRNQQDQRQQEHVDGDDSDGDNEDGHQGGGGNRARRSGKKARRRNLEERRELQRQRQAAIELGFNGGDQAEAVAMQRILEEQIALNEAVDN